ncbi:hypothetical protein BOX15_Mlig028224g1 [Macrostomum lignano]|uniref:Uncharacterized protein n=1 Tax=Macrostomum lignano TaxID=282301 RepID=A0A267GIL2_9PLAT|nr:hypothetical protein BOX15_Mlig028224g1 [Macrostomum lignano]
MSTGSSQTTCTSRTCDRNSALIIQSVQLRRSRRLHFDPSPTVEEDEADHQADDGESREYRRLLADFRRRLATLAAAAATAEVGEDVASHRQPDEDDANLSEMIDLDEGSSVASLSLANKGKLCSGALIKGDGAKSSHRMANAPQQQATLQRPPPPPTHSRVLLRGSNRTLDLAGIGFGLANGSAMAASGTPEQWRLWNKGKNPKQSSSQRAMGLRDSSVFSDAAVTGATGDSSTAEETASYPPISDSQMMGAPTSQQQQQQQQQQHKQALSNNRRALQRPSYARLQQTGGGQNSRLNQQANSDEERYRFAEAAIGGPASFVQRLVEMSALEAETIRHERTKASRRKAKN